MFRAKRIPIHFPTPLLVALITLATAGFTDISALASTEGQLDLHFNQTCTTSGCHDTRPAGGFLNHAPYLEQDCLACHQSHISDTEAPLKPDQVRLCAECHTPVLADEKHRVFHPENEKDCLDCHNPHASRVRNLLRDEQQLASCIECHGAILDLAEAAPYQHHYFNPRTECGNCHYAHQNPEKHYLRPNVRETCLTCHDLPIQAPDRQLRNIAMEVRTKPFVHQVVNEQGCPTCHTPHGSVQSSLMREGYPATTHEEYERKNFALCWQCHDKDLVEASVTTTATNFRDGIRNLHQLHIVGLKKGRSCHLCHEAHASDRPHLLRSTIRFNNWTSEFLYEPKGEGATCTTACHKPQSYDPNVKAPGPKMINP